MRLVGPHLLEQHLAREDNAGIRDEQVQHVELMRSQFDGVRADNGLPAGRVEAQGTCSDGRIMTACGPDGRRTRPAQERTNPGHQFAHAEWLGQIVVGSALEPEDLVRLLATGRQHQDGDIAVQPAAPDGPADRDAVDTGQHEIEHHEVEAPGLDQGQRLVSPTDLGHGQSLEAQVQCDQLPNVRLVLDDEHIGGRHDGVVGVIRGGHRQSAPRRARRPSPVERTRAFLIDKPPRDEWCDESMAAA